MGLFKKENRSAVHALRQMDPLIAGLPTDTSLTNPYTNQAVSLLSGGGMGASQHYLQGLLSGQGLNPYVAGSPYQQYQQAAVQNFNQNVIPQVAEQAAASGLLRGSAAGNMVTRATGQLTNQLQQQGYDAYQQGLNRQYGAAQILPSQLMQQSQLLQGYGMNAIKLLVGHL